MSILIGYEIAKGIEDGTIHISPYHRDQLNPNSYDVRLDRLLKVYENQIDSLGYIHSGSKLRGCLDFRSKNNTHEFIIPDDGHVLMPGILYLGSTIEEAGSDHYIPMIEGRSSAARLGLGCHISAGFGDIGFKNRWTLEITVIHPVKIYPGDKIAQIYFHRVDSTALAAAIADEYPVHYSGKYTDQSSATESRSYLDYTL